MVLAQLQLTSVIFNKLASEETILCNKDFYAVLCQFIDCLRPYINDRSPARFVEGIDLSTLLVKSLEDGRFSRNGETAYLNILFLFQVSHRDMNHGLIFGLRYDV